MSQQLQITGGAKVRSLEGVITGSTGVLGSLPINASNGIPQLDVNGKILVSQLPNSVMEYKGTWNAATNTPTLADGTGNQGDVYLCNVAGTVNFGSGPISFVVGDQVIYSGTIWQKASGATGTVTSVAVTETGDALSITGSPITTSGTINIGFAGSSAQYVAGDGSLITFPTVVTQAQNLVTEVYNNSGATMTKGTVVYINGGHGNLPTIAKALATSDATSAQTYGVVRTDITNNNNGYVTVIGNLDNLDTQAYAAGTQLYLSSTTAGAWTSTKQYAPAHLVYVGIVTRSHPTQGVVEIRIQNGFELDELHNVSAQTPSNNQGIFYNSSTSLWENKSIATALGYTPADDSLVVKLAGTQTITGAKTFTNQPKFDLGLAIKEGTSASITGYTCLGANVNQLIVGIVGATHNLTFPTGAGYTYTFPSATGTLALSSDFSSYVPTSRTLTINGTTYDLSANRSWTINSMVYPSAGIAVSTGTAWGTSITDNSSNWNTAYTLRITSATSPLSISSNVLSISQASGSTNGYLSSTDWTTFNNKQNALTNPITGTGTSGYVTYFNGTSTVTGSANHYWDSTNNRLGIGTTNPQRSITIYNATSDNHLQIAGSAPSVSLTDAVTGATYQAKFALATSANQFYSGVSAGDFITISQGGASIWGTGVGEKMRLTYGGYLGIGTNAPTSPLHVGTATSGNQKIQQWGEPGFVDNYGLILRGSSLDGVFKFYGLNNGTETTNPILSMNRSSGNVGIGTTSSSYPLTVYDGSVNGDIALFQSNISKADIWLKDSGTTAGQVRLRSESNSLQFFTNTSERVRITSGGLVGIGTSSPSTKLDVRGAIGAGQLVTLVNTSGTSNSNTIDIGFSLANDSYGLSTAAVIGVINPAATGNSYGDIYFKTANAGNTISEKMRLTSAGNLVVGSSTAGYAATNRNVIEVNGTTQSLIALKSGDVKQGYFFVTANGGDMYLTKDTGTNSFIFQNQSNGVYLSVGATSWSSISDIRLKNINSNIENAVDSLMTLKTINYSWKSDADKKENLGLIAQEVEKVFPQVISKSTFKGNNATNISEDDTEYLSVRYAELVPVLIKAIQELKAEIDELKNK
jgi:hypothetical protein